MWLKNSWNPKAKPKSEPYRILFPLFFRNKINNPKVKGTIAKVFILVLSNVLGQIVFDEKMDVLRMDNQIEVTLTSGTFVAQLMDKSKNRLKQIKFVKN